MVRMEHISTFYILCRKCELAHYILAPFLYILGIKINWRFLSEYNAYYLNVLYFFLIYQSLNYWPVRIWNIYNLQIEPVCHFMFYIIKTILWINLFIESKYSFSLMYFIKFTMNTTYSYFNSKYTELASNCNCSYLFFAQPLTRRDVINIRIFIYILVVK
jgi:hypothetical protein